MGLLPTGSQGLGRAVETRGGSPGAAKIAIGFHQEEFAALLAGQGHQKKGVSWSCRVSSFFCIDIFLISYLLRGSGALPLPAVYEISRYDSNIRNAMNSREAMTLEQLLLILLSLELAPRTRSSGRCLAPYDSSHTRKWHPSPVESIALVRHSRWVPDSGQANTPLTLTTTASTRGKKPVWR